MNPKQYIKKYNLSEGDKFDHSEFISDFTIDILSLIEWNKAKSGWEYSHFQMCVKQIRQKWDSINNKTLGELPEKLWGYFYATVIVSLRNEMFPEFDERMKEILNEPDIELRGIIQRATGKYFGYYINRDVEIAVMESGNQYAIAAYKEMCRRIAKEKEKERERFYESRGEDFFGFGQGRTVWDFLLSLMRINTIPTSSFLVLGIPTTSTENEIKSSYRKLCLLHHPDKGGKEENFVTITEAKNKCLAYVNTKQKTQSEIHDGV